MMMLIAIDYTLIATDRTQIEGSDIQFEVYYCWIEGYLFGNILQNRQQSKLWVMQQLSQQK